jgi:hypothetical protein
MLADDASFLYVRFPNEEEMNVFIKKFDDHIDKTGRQYRFGERASVREFHNIEMFIAEIRSYREIIMCYDFVDQWKKENPLVYICSDNGRKID